MSSPFPGVDPYIEASGRWGDFYGSMVAAMRTQLNTRLPEGYVASLELYVWVDKPGHRPRRATAPDTYVIENMGATRRAKRSSVLDAPATIELPPVRKKQRKAVHIVDVDSQRVVTAIELLSPSNKSGEDREAYLKKRGEYLASDTSLVEIDLLRGGRRLPLSGSRPRIADYYIMVCRVWDYPRAGFWTFTVRDAIPDIPVPLTPELQNVALSLKACLEESYDGGRYSTLIHYDRPLRPRPSEADATWAKGLLAKRGIGGGH